MTPARSSAAGALPAAEHRHLIENALALYCRAMDEHHAPAAALLLADARLHFKDQPVRAGAQAIADFYAAAFQNPAPTRHLISNIHVQADGLQINYLARYQRWSLAGTQPACETIGDYQGLFTSASGRWVWSEHRVLQY
ncbi:nuclear transport factor 2 family protein [Pseudarthrobacter sp. N5]|uniref:nuclear transport factor 2 family protein n=1 Tax=Pseudarthrobacter sp. N5 TaxID=3418416 RepID=UPI003CE9D117